MIMLYKFISNYATGIIHCDTASRTQIQQAATFINRKMLSSSPADFNNFDKISVGIPHKFIFIHDGKFFIKNGITGFGFKFCDYLTVYRVMKYNIFSIDRADALVSLASYFVRPYKLSLANYKYKSGTREETNLYINTGLHSKIADRYYYSGSVYDIIEGLVENAQFLESYADTYNVLRNKTGLVSYRWS